MDLYYFTSSASNNDSGVFEYEGSKIGVSNVITSVREDFTKSSSNRINVDETVLEKMFAHIKSIEEKEKVFYRLLDPEIIKNKKILVVGGGDSAIESALLLNESHNKVTLSYRNNVFNRIKEANFEKINKAIDEQKIEVLYNSKVIEIKDKSVVLNFSDNSSQIEIENDLVYVFVGGELPNAFLDKIGIKITKRFGEVILKH